MKIRCTPEAFDTLPYNRLFADFATQRSAINAYLDPFSDASVHLAASNITSFPVDARLLDAFNPFELTASQVQHKQFLVDGKALAVVTGQQMVAFGGPVFVLYKALTAIVFARKWTVLLNRPVVPIFWLADEDHDLAEVTISGFPSGTQWNEFSVKPSDAVEGRPAGEYIPDAAACAAFIDAISNLNRDESFRSEIVVLITPQPNETMKNWFLRILNHLFRDFGLLFMGSNHPAAKNRCSSVFKKALRSRSEIKTLLESKSAEVAKTYHQQAPIGSFSFFYFDEKGNRSRFEQLEDGNLSAGGLTGNEAFWLDLMDQFPERFSPNVFLRPILQDELVPTLAYAGGPGEIAYHAQLTGLYRFFDRPKPLLLPRFTGTVLEPADEKTVVENGFSLNDLMPRLEQIEKQWVLKNSPNDPASWFSPLKESGNAEMIQLAAKIKAVDSTLVASLERAEAQFRNELEKVEQKVLRALKQKEETRLNKIRKLKVNVMPREQLQERALPFVWLVARFGPEFIPALLDAFEKELPIDRHSVLSVAFES